MIKEGIVVMILIVILVLSIGVGMGVGYLVGDPVPTKESLMKTYRGATEADMQGKSRKDIYYVISVLNLFKTQLEIEGIGTWDEIIKMAVGNIPPIGKDNLKYREDVKILLERIRIKSNRIVEGFNETQKNLPMKERRPFKTYEDPEIKRMVLFTVIEAMTLGAHDALVSGKTKKVPSMLDGR